MTDRRKWRTAIAGIGRALREYLGAGKRPGKGRIADAAALRHYLDTRASHVTQVSLYGYLRTRAGARFPELFSNDEFVRSISIARWQLWLACLSDLGVFAGGLLFRRSQATPEAVGRLVVDAVEGILSATGVPADAGPEFAATADEVRERLRTIQWTTVQDDASAFTASPAMLVRCAPIVDELKQLDAEIVINSVRFRWQETRRELRELLDADALLAAAAPAADGGDAAAG